MVHASGLADPRPSCCAKGLTLDELLRASATLDQQNATRSPDLAGRLSGRDRAARCPTRRDAPASDTSRPSPSPGCQIAPVGSLYHRWAFGPSGRPEPSPAARRTAITSRLRTD